MVMARNTGGGLIRFLLAGGLLLGSAILTWAAPPPTVQKMLEYKPRHEVNYSTPSLAEQASCKVDQIKSGTGSGWVLLDGQGRYLRKFFASNGQNIDQFSYYKDGLEVYREIITPGARTPDHFRWFNSGGSKYGVDTERKGTITSWRIISAEEVSQEVLRALATNDLARLQALLITDEEIKALGLGREMVEDLLTRRKGVEDKFKATRAKMPKLDDKAVWLHLETGAPQCLPADQTGSRHDVIRYSRATVLVDVAGSNEWFQIGPMLQVGGAWRIIDGPVAGMAIEDEQNGRNPNEDIDIGQDPKLQKLVEELTRLDKQQVAVTGPEAVKHYLTRADLLEEIVKQVKPQKRDPWIRQVADSLASAIQANPSDTVASSRLLSLEKQLMQAIPTSNLTAYVVFRRMQGDYSVKLLAGKNFDKVQQEWLDNLTSFIKTFPKADDVPDAMLQLGMVSEFLDKDVEAKNWYADLARSFPGKPQARKAEGSLRRLGLEGTPIQLVGNQISDGKPFDITQLQGKIVIVYYWASWNGQAASDFTKLKSIVSANDKEVEVLAINLDASVEEAKAFLGKNTPIGIHLHEDGGLESKLATQYGIQVLPCVFLIGKDGKCVNRASQIATVDDEIKKLLKK